MLHAIIIHKSTLSSHSLPQCSSMTPTLQCPVLRNKRLSIPPMFKLLAEEAEAREGDDHEEDESAFTEAACSFEEVT